MCTQFAQYNLKCAFYVPDVFVCKYVLWDVISHGSHDLLTPVFIVNRFDCT